MPLRPVDLTVTDTFEIDSDPDFGTELSTKFKCRRLSPRLEGWVGDQASSFRQDGDGEAIGHFEPNKAAYSMVQVALVGWENFLDDAGNLVPFKTMRRNIAGQDLTIPTPDTMSKLQLSWIRELHKKITEANAVGNDEAKASGS